MVAVWKGHIAFGAVCIPVKLFAAARHPESGLNQIHRPCGSRIKQLLHCPSCDRVVSRNELVKGVEVENEQFVLLEAAELDGLKPEPSRTMSVLEFVKASDVDPIRLDAGYHLSPDGSAGARPCSLLAQTLRKKKRVGIARLVMRQKEYTVVLRPYGSGLMVHTMYYEAEIREMDPGEPIEVSQDELELAGLLVDAMTRKFEPGKYGDQGQLGLAKLILEKTAAGLVRGAGGANGAGGASDASSANGSPSGSNGSSPNGPNIPDLMDLLKASLEMNR